MNNHILVVEDDQAIQELLQTALELESYKVSVAEDGLSALDLLETITPDLILLDFMMPRMDGYSFAKAIRCQEALASIPIILLSANVIESSIVGEMQVDAYIKKPFDLDHVLDQIMKAMQQSPSPPKC